MSDQPSPQSKRVLAIAGAGDSIDAIIQDLDPNADVQRVDSIDDALRLLARDQFDLVLLGSSKLLPVARSAEPDEANAILERLSQGLCIVEADGTLGWANSAIATYPQDVVDTIRKTCAAVAAEFAAQASDEFPTPRRRTMCVGHKYYLDLTISPLPDSDGRVHRVVGLAIDTTATGRLRAKIDAIDAAGRRLVELGGQTSERLELPDRLHLLEDTVTKYCEELLDFTHFTVRVLDPKTNRLDTVLAGGFPDHAKDLEIFAVKDGGGISGYVATTGQSYLCPDISQDARYLPGIESARSSLTVPLRLADQVVGILNVESDQVAAFTEEDRQVAEIFGRYVAVALQMLKLLAVERSETAGQVTSDVRAELAEPLNEIVAMATRLIQSEPLPDRGLERLEGIITKVDEVKSAIAELAEGAAVRGLISESTAAAQILRGKRVLVADDEDIIRETIADVLSKAGAITVMARDGDEAVSMIEAQHFNLVLSDIKMPYKNGYEVFAAARARYHDCPVILITGFGYDPEHSIVRASREGLAGVLFKPFKVDQLFELIEKALEPGATWAKDV